jgi:hypothetical protein
MTEEERTAAYARIFQMADAAEEEQQSELAAVLRESGVGDRIEDVGLSTNDEATAKELEDAALTDHMSAARDELARLEKQTSAAPRMAEIHTLLVEGGREFSKEKRAIEGALPHLPDIASDFAALNKAVTDVKGGGTSAFFGVGEPLPGHVRTDPAIKRLLQAIADKSEASRDTLDKVSGLLEKMVRTADSSVKKFQRALGLLVARAEALETELKSAKNVARLASSMGE